MAQSIKVEEAVIIIIIIIICCKALLAINRFLFASLNMF
jgi:hypothetical protein